MRALRAPRSDRDLLQSEYREHDDVLFRLRPASGRLSDMITLDLDLSAFRRAAQQMQAAQDQVPFALASALNTAAFRMKDTVLPEVWAEHVTVRDPGFLRGSLRVEKATKRNLSVAVFDNRRRASLLAHAKGGTKFAKRQLNIPPSTGKVVTRGRSGVPKRQRPAAILANTPKRALRVLPHGIFVGEGGRLWLRFSAKTSASIKRDVPFFESWQRVMAAEARWLFPAAMKKAMRTRR